VNQTKGAKAGERESARREVEVLGAKKGARFSSWGLTAGPREGKSAEGVWLNLAKLLLK